jgi:hypothetical protein
LGCFCAEVCPSLTSADPEEDSSSLGDQAANFNVGCNPTREANTSSMSVLKSRQPPFINVERLETGHRGTAPLDGAMVLFNYIVEVSAAPDFDAQPLRILPPKDAART